MKIGETTNQFPDFPHQKKVKEKPEAGVAKGVGAKAEPEFAEAFLQVSANVVKGSLNDLMAGVQEQGERLARNQNFEELNKYKDLVRAFLLKVSKELYQVKISDGGAQVPGQKVYVILQKVDLELDNLTKLVLQGQVPQLRILEKLDQIRGLLLDSYK